jgi:RNA polymerase sigma factor (TIGR02999 family)
VTADPARLDANFSLAYEELRRMARGIIHGNSARDISATTLVNEAWLKLSSASELSPVDHLHFRRIVAQAMRFILVDASRRRSSKIRGTADVPVTFDESLYAGCTFHLGPELLDLNAALDALATFSPRQAELIEARFFGGMTAEEMVLVFDVSESTVVRELRMAKAWLAREIRPSRRGSAGSCATTG